jgi:hypothetical protein
MDSLGNTMKSATCLLVFAALFIVGCGRALGPTASDEQATHRTPPDTSRNGGSEQEGNGEEVAWTPSLLDGGGMFQDFQHFGWYVRSAQIVATGVLREWDGTKGNVQLDSVLHGEIKDASVLVVATGGFVRPKRGDKVLFLLSPRDGQLKLHSFCAASGMYNFSDDLASVIKRALESKR